MSREAKLKERIKNLENALRIVEDAEWMVDCTWTDREVREAMWETVHNLAGPTDR